MSERVYRGLQEVNVAIEHFRNLETYSHNDLIDWEKGMEALARCRDVLDLEVRERACLEGVMMRSNDEPV